MNPQSQNSLIKSKTFFLSGQWFFISFMVFLASVFFVFENKFTFTIIVFSLFFPTFIVATFLFLGFFDCVYLFQKYFKDVKNKCKECGNENPPLYVCPKCNEPCKLEPSIYGLFNTFCLSTDCGYKLPTTYLRREKLGKVCSKPNCQKGLDHSYQGKVSEFPFAIAGPASCGKTTFLYSATSSFKDGFAKTNNIGVNFGTTSDRDAFNSMIAEFKKGKTLDATVRGTPKAISFNIDYECESNRRNKLIQIFDASGEQFTGGEDFLINNHFIQDYKGIFLIIDPFGEARVSNGGVGGFSKKEIESNRPAHKKSIDCLIRLKNVFEKLNGVGKKINVPIAVIVTKVDQFQKICDLIKKSQNLSKEYDDFSDAAIDAESHSSVIRKFLLKDLGLNNFISIVEQSCTKVSYFGVSSLGRPYKFSDNRKFNSFGVQAPLIWLFEQCHVFNDEEFEKGFRAVHFNFIKEPNLFLMSLVLTALCCLLILFFIMPLLLSALVIGIPFIGLSILYFYMFYNFVYFG